MDHAAESTYTYAINTVKLLGLKQTIMELERLWYMYFSLYVKKSFQSYELTDPLKRKWFPTSKHTLSSLRTGMSSLFLTVVLAQHPFTNYYL